MKKLLVFGLMVAVPGLGLAQSHLIFSEFVVTPTAGEFIEIFNPTPEAVDLTNYYLSDHHTYYGVVNGSQTPDVVNDFLARFPAGFVISSGDVIVVAMNSNGFKATYPSAPAPDFELAVGTSGDDPAVPNMIAPAAGPGIGTSAGLTNSNEILILFLWDQVSDLVKDVDYVRWGTATTANPLVDKTGISIDGPDTDITPSTYLNDTPATSQSTLTAPTFGFSAKRISLAEIGEVTTGGNGLPGHDETSENLAASWESDNDNATGIDNTPSPGDPSPVPVELASFQAEVKNNSIELTWITATETNNLGFDIERSLDGQTFMKVAFVKGFGTTAVSQTYRYIDEELVPATYYYRLKQVDTNGAFKFSEVVTAIVGMPETYTLYSNYPNPFNPVTVIPFTIARSNYVVLKVFNITGQEVASLVNQALEAGFHEVSFNASALPSGIYFYRLTVDDFIAMGKMALVR